MTAAVSVVVPLFNERESLPALYEQLRRISATMETKWEYLFVDDGSRDGTWETLVALQAQDARVRTIRLKRNFGQTPVMECGIDHARGDVVVTMDGDLQNDPADIPRLLAKLDEGYDVVCGWRYQRQDKLWTRKIPSMVANRLIGWLTGVRLHDYGCSLKAYRAEVIKRTPLYAQFHRFIPAFVTLTGALITEIKVTHHPRRFGRTKYTISRTWRVALDMVTVSLLVKFAGKPLRFCGTLALVAATVGLACIVRSWEWYIGPYHMISQVLPGAGVMSLWLAGHLFIVGLIAELCLTTSHARPGQLIAAQEPV